MLPTAADNALSTEAEHPSTKRAVTGTAGKPTSSTTPEKPITRPVRPPAVIRSIPQSCPITIEKRGMAATKMAAIAVPIRGVATESPTSCPATVVAPTAASGRHPPKASRRRVTTASTVRTTLAVSARKATAPTHPKAWTTRRTRTNDAPHTPARTT